MLITLPLTLKDVLIEKLAEAISTPLPVFTPRQIRGIIALPGKVTAVVGMRRAGKTTFLQQLRWDKLHQGTPLTHLPYLNFEDERLAGLKAAHLGFLLDEFARRTAGGPSQARATWFFDEIQVVPGWERFVRRLLDTGASDVFVTGSSAALLSREIATALRGRAWEAPLYPFSFAEALRHQGRDIPPETSFLSGVERAGIERSFLDWLTVGGFPEAQGLDPAARRQLLQDYVDVAILRDVVERHGVSNVVGLRWLVRHLLGNAAGTFTVEKFHAGLKSQGVAISRDTVHQLLAHLEDCFLVRTVWMEATSERQRMVNPRKTYSIDPGLIPLFDRSGRRNHGHALENAVLLELERRRYAVTYVRTPEGHEVDFLARDPLGNETLIQVCLDAADPATAQRELRALAEAARPHPGAQKLLLTLNKDGAPADIPEDVTVCPAYEWMLSEPAG